ncbi:amino acid permease-domain-containing protein [Gongronella butleri]|nr:amino acid permease-domain-containing protein [Gongronella butleri]
MADPLYDPNKICQEDGLEQVSSDQAALASFGYKQEMNKTMSTISNFSIAFGCCSILSGLTPLWGDVMLMGGSISVVWGWVIVSFFTFGVGLSLAEICSSITVTGGPYVWVSRLAPPAWVPLACFVTGWCNWLGLTVAITSADLGLATFMSSVIHVAYPDANVSIYWQYGIFLAIVMIHGVINSISVKYNGIFNEVSLWWHLIGTLLIVIVALVLTPNKASASWVFTFFENHTGFSSNTYAFLIGLLQSQYTLSGFDSAAQMSEETRDAATSAPRGILYAIGTAAVCGLVFMVAVNFCVQDYDRQIVSATLRPQMTQVFLDGVGYTWTMVFMAIVMGAMFFSGSALTLGSSRMVYAFARDGATPFSDYLSHVNPRTRTPIYAVWFNIAFAAVVGLLYIVNSTAFNAIVSVNTIASSFAYFIPISLRLTVARKSFERGPFHLGPFSTAINLVSCLWIIFTSVLFVCPTVSPVTTENANYASVIFVFVIGTCVLYYEVQAKHWFTGPGHAIQLTGDNLFASSESMISEGIPDESERSTSATDVFVVKKDRQDSSDNVRSRSTSDKPHPPF